MYRKLFHALSVSLVVPSLAIAAHASPITAGTYNLTDTTISAGSNSYTFTGTVTVGSNGLITAADITLNDAAVGNPVFNTVTSTGGPAGYDPVADYGYITSASGGQLYLSYLTTLNSSGDIQLCILSADNCNAYQASTSQLSFESAFGYSPVDLTAGTIDPNVATTPEPSSLVLLGTGMFGLAGVIRKRVARA